MGCNKNIFSLPTSSSHQAIADAIDLISTDIPKPLFPYSLL